MVWGLYGGSGVVWFPRLFWGLGGLVYNVLRIRAKYFPKYFVNYLCFKGLG